MPRKTTLLTRMAKSRESGRLTVPADAIKAHSCEFGEDHEYYYDKELDAHVFKRISKQQSKDGE